MTNIFRPKRRSSNSKIITVFLALIFTFHFLIPPSYAQLISSPQSLNLPVPGVMVHPSKVYQPTLIHGVTIDPKDALKFNFLIQQGEERFSDEEFTEESKRLIKYFLASLTVPEEEMWVNLSPFEKENVISKSLGQTEMGRDLLAQDYLLKQLTASLLYPEAEFGKKFWNRIRQKAYKDYGTTDIPMDTFHKVWIVPGKASVYESGLTAFVTGCRLKVMLEQDYLAFEQSRDDSKLNVGRPQLDVQDLNNQNALNIERPTLNVQRPTSNKFESEILREIILPELEKEVNQGRHFAQLRQMSHAMVLAAWYKQRLKESLLGQVYVDQAKTQGVEVQDKDINQKIYQRYVEAYRKGVYNYIREEQEYFASAKQIVPRKYFSGGAEMLWGRATQVRPLARTPMAMIPIEDLKTLQALDEGERLRMVEVALLELTKNNGNQARALAESVRPRKAIPKMVDRPTKPVGHDAAMLSGLVRELTLALEAVAANGSFELYHSYGDDGRNTSQRIWTLVNQGDNSETLSVSLNLNSIDPHLTIVRDVTTSEVATAYAQERRTFELRTQHTAFLSYRPLVFRTESSSYQEQPADTEPSGVEFSLPPEQELSLDQFLTGIGLNDQGEVYFFVTERYQEAFGNHFLGSDQTQPKLEALGFHIIPENDARVSEVRVINVADALQRGRLYSALEERDYVGMVLKGVDEEGEQREYLLQYHEGLDQTTVTVRDKAGSNDIRQYQGDQRNKARYQFLSRINRGEITGSDVTVADIQRVLESLELQPQDQKWIVEIERLSQAEGDQTPAAIEELFDLIDQVSDDRLLKKAVGALETLAGKVGEEEFGRIFLRRAKEADREYGLDRSPERPGKYGIITTPLEKAEFFTQASPIPVWGKLEFFNPTGSFKKRFAIYLQKQMERLPGEGKKVRYFVSASTGNHAVASSAAAKDEAFNQGRERFDQIQSVVFLPFRTPENVRADLRANGADLIIDMWPDGSPIRTYFEARDLAKAFHHEHEGESVMSPHSGPSVSGGYSTIVLELARQIQSNPELRNKKIVVLVPSGEGGAAIFAVVARALGLKNVRFVAFGTEDYDSLYKSAEAGQPMWATGGHLDGRYAVWNGGIGVPLVDPFSVFAAGLGLEGDNFQLALVFNEVARLVTNMLIQDFGPVEGAGGIAGAGLFAEEVVQDAEAAIVIITGNRIAPEVLSELREDDRDIIIREHLPLIKRLLEDQERLWRVKRQVKGAGISLMDFILGQRFDLVGVQKSGGDIDHSQDGVLRYLRGLPEGEFLFTDGGEVLTREHVIAIIEGLDEGPGFNIRIYKEEYQDGDRTRRNRYVVGLPGHSDGAMLTEPEEPEGSAGKPGLWMRKVKSQLALTHVAAAAEAIWQVAYSEYPQVELRISARNGSIWVFHSEQILPKEKRMEKFIQFLTGTRSNTLTISAWDAAADEKAAVVERVAAILEGRVELIEISEPTGKSPDAAQLARALDPNDAKTLETLENIYRRALWLILAMISTANQKTFEGKVGAHAATAASMLKAMLTLELVNKRGQDHVQYIPHTSPAWYAILFLMGHPEMTKEKLGLLRENRIHPEENVAMSQFLKAYFLFEPIFEQVRTDIESRMDPRALANLKKTINGLHSYPGMANPELGVGKRYGPSGSVGLQIAHGVGLEDQLEYLRAQGFLDDLSAEDAPHIHIYFGDGEWAEGNVKEVIEAIYELGVTNVTFYLNANRKTLMGTEGDFDAKLRRIRSFFADSEVSIQELKWGRRLLNAFETVVEDIEVGVILEMVMENLQASEHESLLDPQWSLADIKSYLIRIAREEFVGEIEYQSAINSGGEAAVEALLRKKSPRAPIRKRERVLVRLNTQQQRERWDQLLAKDPNLDAFERYIGSISDEEFFELFTDLGGHDMVAVAKASERSRADEQFAHLVILHTLKGKDLRLFEEGMSRAMGLLGAELNHGALPDEQLMVGMAEHLGISDPQENPFAHLNEEPDRFSDELAFLTEATARLAAETKADDDRIEARRIRFIKELMEMAEIYPTFPERLPNLSLRPGSEKKPITSTTTAGGFTMYLRMAFQAVARSRSSGGTVAPVMDFWSRFFKLTPVISPDVSDSTGHGQHAQGNVRGGGEVDWMSRINPGASGKRLLPSAQGTHVRLDIMEAFAVSLGAAYGIDISGQPLFPIVALYAYFVDTRALDQMKNAGYIGANLLVQGTPSGTETSAEGGSHTDFTGLLAARTNPGLIGWSFYSPYEQSVVETDRLKRILISWLGFDDPQKMAWWSEHHPELATAKTTLLRFLGVEEDADNRWAGTKGRSVVYQSLSPIALPGNKVNPEIWLPLQKRYEGRSFTELRPEFEEDILKGGYVLMDWEGYTAEEARRMVEQQGIELQEGAEFWDYDARDVVTLVAHGPLVHQVMEEAHELLSLGVFPRVIVITSPNLSLGSLGQKMDNNMHLREVLLPPSIAQHSPVIAFASGAPEVLSGLGKVARQEVTYAGLTQKGLSTRSVTGVWRHFGIDAVTGTSLALMRLLDNGRVPLVLQRSIEPRLIALANRVRAFLSTVEIQGDDFDLIHELELQRQRVVKNTGELILGFEYWRRPHTDLISDITAGFLNRPGGRSIQVRELPQPLVPVFARLQEIVQEELGWTLDAALLSLEDHREHLLQTGRQWQGKDKAADSPLLISEDPKVKAVFEEEEDWLRAEYARYGMPKTLAEQVRVASSIAPELKKRLRQKRIPILELKSTLPNPGGNRYERNLIINMPESGIFGFLHILAPYQETQPHFHGFNVFGDDPMNALGFVFVLEEGLEEERFTLVDRRGSPERPILQATGSNTYRLKPEDFRSVPGDYGAHLIRNTTDQPVMFFELYWEPQELRLIDFPLPILGEQGTQRGILTSPTLHLTAPHLGVIAQRNDWQVLRGGEGVEKLQGLRSWVSALESTVDGPRDAVMTPEDAIKKLRASDQAAVLYGPNGEVLFVPDAAMIAGAKVEDGASFPTAVLSIDSPQTLNRQIAEAVAYVESQGSTREAKAQALRNLDLTQPLLKAGSDDVEGLRNVLQVVSWAREFKEREVDLATTIHDPRSPEEVLVSDRGVIDLENIFRDDILRNQVLRFLSSDKTELAFLLRRKIELLFHKHSPLSYSLSGVNRHFLIDDKSLETLFFQLPSLINNINKEDWTQKLYPLIVEAALMIALEPMSSDHGSHVSLEPDETPLNVDIVLPFSLVDENVRAIFSEVLNRYSYEELGVDIPIRFGIVFDQTVSKVVAQEGIFEGIDFIVMDARLFEQPQEMEAFVDFRNRHPGLRLHLMVDQYHPQQMQLAEELKVDGLIVPRKDAVLTMLAAAQLALQEESGDRALLMSTNRSVPEFVTQSTADFDQLGGIDFNAEHLDLQIERDGNGIPLPLAMQSLENIEITGFVPMVLRVSKVRSLPVFSKLFHQRDPQKTTRDPKESALESPLAYLGRED